MASFIFAIISFAMSVSQLDALIIWLPAGLAVWLFLFQVRYSLVIVLGTTIFSLLLFFDVTKQEASLENHHFAALALTALISPFSSLVVAKFLGRLRDGARELSTGTRDFALLVLVFSILSMLPALLLIPGYSLPIEEIGNIAARDWFAQFLGVVIFAPAYLDFFQRRHLQEHARARKLSDWVAVYAIPVAVFSSTVFAWQATHSSLERSVNTQFDALVSENEDALKSKIHSYENAVLGSAGLIYASETVSRQEWRSYVQTLNVAESFPGISGIGFIKSVDQRDMRQFIASQQRDGAAEFAPHPEVFEDSNYIIQFIEPIETNAPALGLNIAFERNRKAAADLAAKTRNSAITDRILLVQDSEQTPGFLLLHPIYETPLARTEGEPISSTLLGWVYAPFIGKNLLQDLTSAQGSLFNVAIYAGKAEDEDKLIYSSSNEVASLPNSFNPLKRQKTIDLLQKEWTIIWCSTTAFTAQTTNHQPEYILVGGSLISCLLGLFLATVTNSAARVRAEVDYKTSEIANARNGLQAVLDTVVDGVVQISKDGRILGFNPSAERIFGYAADEVIGKNVNVLMPEPYHSQHDGYIHNFLSTGKKRIIGMGRTVSAMRKDGSIFPMELGVNQIQQDGDIAFVGSIRDITDRVAAEEALKQEEQNFRQTMQLAPIPAVAISPEGKLIRANNALQQLLGYEEDELKGTNSKLSHPDDISLDAQQMKQVLAGAISFYSVEKRLITKAGKIVWVEQHVSLVKKANGEPKYFLKQMINLTERKKTQLIKDEFIATVSHELRTPITSISGALGLIIGAFSKDLPEKVSDLLQIAHNNSERLIAIVNDILDMEKLGSGQMHYEFKDLSLEYLLTQSLSLNASYAEKHEVELELIQPDKALKLHVDELRFNQVLTNFISNACKFSPAGGRVRVETKRVGKRVRICVADNGSGIPDEFRNRIFTKFAQADSSSTRKKGGTGLGLMISKQIVEQMNGAIGFESTPNVETVFWAEFEPVT